MKWLPIVKVETTIVVVGTDRGIEVATKQNNFCHNADVGDYALCKFTNGHLVMVDYSKEEVKA